jgi:copper homeostasis protein (lipoprotein)
MEHPMTYRTAFTLGLCAAALALAACKPSSDTAAPADAMAPSEAVAPEAAHDTATDVLKEVDNSPAPEGLDVRAFAGSFKGTLPCADCPGIDSTIELKADGSYATHDVYQERDASFDSTGTWTVEEAGKRIRLDPNSKDEVDRLYEVVSNDELRMLDGDGKAIESGLDYSLHRSR